MRKAEIGQNAKVEVEWHLNDGEYTKEKEDSIRSEMAIKYGIPEKNIKVKAVFSENDAKGNSETVVKDIYNPSYMQDLMKKYMEDNGVKDVAFEDIVKIDSKINSQINFDSYNNGKRYTIKWVKWSNFLSYGKENYFDFTTLHGLILLNGVPANKSGKSTFAYDLLHFLLFGKTNTNKAKTLGELFNNYLPNENTLYVHGCIEIEGTEYEIKRTLTRSTKGKVKNEVKYYKVSNGMEEELSDEENLQEATTTATSKVIKEALGNESDFDLIISANAKDLDALISLTETERGRLLSRWIGLSVIEDKDAIARQMWNKEVSVGRYSGIYNRVQLNADIDALTETNIQGKKAIEDNNKVIAASDSKIAAYNKSRDALLSSKLQIDNSLLKTDVQTLETRLLEIQNIGKGKRIEVASVQEQIASMGDIQYSDDEYKNLRKENDALISEIASGKAKIAHIQGTNKALATAEYCPTCHRKLENVDNSAQIKQNEQEIAAIKESMDNKEQRKAIVVAEITKIDELRTLYNQKSKLQLKESALNVEITNLLAEYKEKKALMKEIEKNKEAIAKNTQIDAELNVVTESIRTEEKVKQDLKANNDALSHEISKNTDAIAQKKSYIVKIEEEEKTEKCWKLYLKMIGKDGISKMVLKDVLPLINAQMDRMLDDVADFKVRIDMDEKNDVNFYMIRDDVVTRLSAASGLEKTQASLALRVVLGQQSRLSRPPFILLDEVLGTVAKENYDDMKLLYDKIVKYYDFVLHICHIDLDWYDEKNVITVQKIDNISSIKSNI